MSLRPGTLARYRNAWFIETGTWRGDAVAEALAAGFTHVVSMEIDPALAAAAAARFASDARVEILCGDSRRLLADVLARSPSPATIWLDAHYSGEPTGGKPGQTPILEELAIIRASGQAGHTLLIDDLRCFSPEELADFVYVSVDDIVAAVRAINPRYGLVRIAGSAPGDILVAVPPPSDQLDRAATVEGTECSARLS